MLILLSASIFQLIAVSVDRFRAICHPFSYRKKNVTGTKFIILVCWSLGILVGILPILTTHTEKSCHFYLISDSNDINYFQLLSLVIIGATIAIFVLYGFIYKAIRAQVRSFNYLSQHFKHFHIQFRKNLSNVEGSSEVICRKEVRATKTMFIVIGTFSLCWLPLAIYFVLKSTVTGPNYSEFSIFIDAFCFCATHYNSAIDPIIYAYRMKNIRNAIKRTLRCGQDTPEDQMQSSSAMS
jgi:hypothetical protein